MERIDISIGIYLQGSDCTLVIQDEAATRVETCDLESLPALLKELGAAGHRIGVVVDVPTIRRQLTFPFKQQRKARQALPIQLEGQLPGTIGDYTLNTVLVASDASIEGNVTLVENIQLEPYQDLFDSVGLTPKFICVAGAILAQPTAAEDGACYLYVGEQYTSGTVFRNGSFVSIFTVPIGLAQLDNPAAEQNLLQRLGMAETETYWTLHSSDRTHPALQRIAQVLSGHDQVEWDDDERVHTTAAEQIAAAAAEAIHQRRMPLWNLVSRKPFAAAGALKHPGVPSMLAATVCALVLMAVSYGVGTSAVSMAAENTRSEVTKVYTRNFPEGRVLDPLRQMRGKLGDQGDDSGSAIKVRAIDGLKHLYSVVGDDAGLKFTEIRYASGEWILKGEAPNLEAVDRLQQSIAATEWAQNTQLQGADPKIDRSAFRFQITWSSKAKS